MSSRSELLRVIEKIETVRLDESIYLIIGNNRGTFPYCNALLIVDDDAVLIDSGCGNEIMEQLADNVDILINSHYHIDHILGNALIGELWVVEEEAGVTSSFEKYRQYAGIYNEPVEEEWLAWFHDWFVFIPSKHTRTFHTNEAFDFGDTKWQVVHTPGHSPGHCCFYEPDKKVMFSSDIDLTRFGPWYGNPNADLNDSIESIKKIKEFDIQTIATSHAFPLTEGIRQALDDYLNAIYEREQRILSSIEDGMKMKDLEKKNLMYREEQKQYKAFAWFEKKMIEKHVERLIENGKIKESHGDIQLV